MLKKKSSEKRCSMLFLISIISVILFITEKISKKVKNKGDKKFTKNIRDFNKVDSTLV